MFRKQGFSWRAGRLPCPGGVAYGGLNPQTTSYGLILCSPGNNALFQLRRFLTVWLFGWELQSHAVRESFWGMFFARIPQITLKIQHQFAFVCDFQSTFTCIRPADPPNSPVKTTRVSTFVFILQIRKLDSGRLSVPLKGHHTGWRWRSSVSDLLILCHSVLLPGPAFLKRCLFH